ncbi:hypothetical protein HD595_004093 [Nonomuraea roseoviolacea subsp. carminata]|uniref:Uncharacterized protein n=1 Tax=Nonomuraea roseoviolacea subsp. carminata TaxID=160689 RepID=A0ABT1K1U0_9ACTN|nr:hypothetical protein [Nonomuraea roseoviolacea subsp. carminata]
MGAAGFPSASARPTMENNGLTNTMAASPRTSGQLTE